MGSPNHRRPHLRCSQSKAEVRYRPLSGADRQTSACSQRVVSVFLVGSDLERLVGGLPSASNFVSLKFDDAVTHGLVLSLGRRTPDFHILGELQKFPSVIRSSGVKRVKHRWVGITSDAKAVSEVIGPDCLKCRFALLREETPSK
jgi:hypothetical protein